MRGFAGLLSVNWKPFLAPLSKSKACERRQWRIQRAGFGAAVEKREEKCEAPDAFFGHRKSLLDFWGFVPKRLGDSFYRIPSPLRGPLPFNKGRKIR